MLPQSLDEVDATWLSSALDRKYPGAQVLRVDRGTVIHGTATKVRLLIDYGDSGHEYRLPPTMWYKGGLEAHSGGTDMQSVYEIETRFYRDIAPQLDLTLPASHAELFDEATGQSALLLEDMLGRNARFGYATSPASPRLAASVLGQLARLHGAFWGDSTLQANRQLAAGGVTLASFLQSYLFEPVNWERCRKLPRGAFLNEELSDLQHMDAMMQAMLAHDRACGVSLVHGDAHLGNVCILPGEQASFLDWQAVMLGHWAHDVAYFLAAAMTVEDRRKHEKELIEHYRLELNRAGGTLSAQAAWEEYRRHVLYAFCWFPCNPEWQPEEVAATNAERAIAAILDLDALSFWR